MAARCPSQLVLQAEDGDGQGHHHHATTVLGQTADGTRRSAEEALSQLGCLEGAEATAGLADLSPARTVEQWAGHQEEGKQL